MRCSAFSYHEALKERMKPMRVLIVRNQANCEASEAAFMLCAYLDSEGHERRMLDASAFEGIDERESLVEQVDGMDLVVVLGGDGTIIRAASVVRGSAPILGINFGHLGFLANDSHEGVVSLVSRAIADELHRSRRACVEARLLDEDGRLVRSCFAVNEVAITRGVSGRSLEFRFSVSDVPMASLRGDGLIVSTATGSTGYALAAGGPLVTPGFSGVVVQPLAPHALRSRALLADANDVVDVQLSRTEDERCALILVDGDVVPLEVPISHVEAVRASEGITFLYAQPDHFLSYSAEKFFS